ncbi:MAG: NAD(P)/FAD-dependent oxidoreductase [bacterium]
MKNSYDVIVVGGGVNGLTAAAYLAKAGLDVLVLERRDEAGAHCSTEEVTIPGFRHNLHATWIIAGSGPVVEDLELENFGFQPLITEYDYGFPFPDGTCLLMHTYDFQKTYASWARFSRKDADTFLQLAGATAPLIPELMDIIVYRAPSPENFNRALEILDSVEMLPRGVIEMNGLELLDVLFENERVKAMLASLEWIGGMPPWNRLVGALGALMVLSLGPVYACHQLRGGSHSLPHALVRCLVRNGGSILYSCPVERIVVESGRAAGVRLSKNAVFGEMEFSARLAVISNLTAQPTFLQLVGEENLPPNAAARIKLFRYDEQVLFGAHYALNAPPAWKAAGFDPGIGNCFMGYMGAETMKDIEDFSISYIAGKIHEKIMVNWFVPTLADPTQAPEGCHTAFAWLDAPYDLRRLGGPEKWDDIKHGLLDRVTARWEEFAPGFTKSILAAFPYTPLDIFRRNPSAVKGNWIGGSVCPGQLYLDRPFAGETTAPRTPVPGLYISNSIWPPGTTFLGAGYVAADVVARDLGVRDREWWRAKPINWWRRFLSKYF